MTGTDTSVGFYLKEWKEWLHFIGSSPGTIEVYYNPLRDYIKEHGLKASQLTDITEREIDAHINPKSDIGVRTRRLRRAGIKSFFRFCKGRGYCHHDPVDICKVRTRNLEFFQKEKRCLRPVTQEEYDKLQSGFSRFLETAKGRNIKHKRRVQFFKWLTTVAYWTGLRIGDIISLETDAIQGTNLIVWTRKRDKRVALDMLAPIHGEGILLKVFQEVEPVGRYVFHVEQSILEKDPKNSILPRSFSRWANKMGVEGPTMHCFRRAFVTRLKDSGMEFADIAHLVGHSDPRTTEGYYG